MIENAESIQNERIIWPCAWCADGGTLWMFHGKYNILFQYSLKTEEAVALCIPEKEELVKEALMCAIVKVDKGVYMIPLWGNHIHYYDFIEKIETILPFPKEAEYGNKIVFCAAFKYGRNIYCIPEQYSDIVVIDTDTNDVKCESVLFGFDLEGKIINDAVITEEGIIFVVVAESNSVISFDTNTGKVNLIKIGDSDMNFGRICLLNDLLCIAEYNKRSIVIYNIVNKRVESINIVGLEAFEIMKIDDERILIDSVNDERYSIWRIKNKIIIREKEKRNSNSVDVYSYHHGIITSNSLGTYYYDRHTYNLYEINDGELDSWNKKNINTMKNESLHIPRDSAFISENKFLNLDWFLEEMKYQI